MKVFKKLAGLCLALTLCSGICAFAACGESDPADSTPTQSTPVVKEGYKFKIVDKDGNPVQGYYVQLCDDIGCKTSSATDANGEVVFAPSSGAGVYDIHVFTGSAQPNHNGLTQTPAEYNSDVIVLTLAE